MVPGEFTTSSTAGMQRCNPDDLCGLETFHEKIRMPKLFKLFLRCSIGFFSENKFLSSKVFLFLRLFRAACQRAIRNDAESPKYNYI